MIRRECHVAAYLFPILTVLAVINAILPAAVEHARNQGLIVALLNGFGQSFIIWLSIAVAIWLWAQSKSSHVYPGMMAVALAGVISLSLMIPFATTAWAAAALLAVIWRLFGCHDLYSRAALILVFALSVREPISRMLLTLCSSEILSFDATVAAMFLNASGHEFNVIGNLIVQDNGYSLLILTGCSAFENLSLSLLLWAALTLMLHLHFQRADSIRAGLVIVCVIGFNSLRLALMALGSDWYDMLHEGIGATAHEMGSLLLTLACVQWRSRYEDDANNTGSFVPSPSGCTGDSAT